MQETDLMIGNYVKISDTHPSINHNQTTRVTAILENGFVMTDASYEPIHPHYIEPVPLTQEILGRTGFRRNDFDYEISEDFLLSHGKYKEGYRLFVKDSNDNDVHVTYVNHVHELQNICHAFGIDKEIKAEN